VRYPSRNGLALPVQELGYEVVQWKRRETSRHHLQFDRTDYMHTPLHRVFRGLLSRVVDMRIEDHNDLHKQYFSPIMPSNTQMIDCIEEYYSENGTIDVVREKKTHETYQLGYDTWQNIKSQYGVNNGIQQVYRPGALRDSERY
jgi:hypothetical protein